MQNIDTKTVSPKAATHMVPPMGAMIKERKRLRSVLIKIWSCDRPPPLLLHGGRFSGGFCLIAATG